MGPFNFLKIVFFIILNALLYTILNQITKYDASKILWHPLS